MSNVMSKQKGGTQCSDSNAGIMIRRFRTAARIGSRACFQTICRMIFSPSMTMHINMHINKKNVSANVQTDIGWDACYKRLLKFSIIQQCCNQHSGRLPHTGWSAGHCEMGRGPCRNGWPPYRTGNIIGAFALNGQLEDASHHGSRFLVNQPVVFVLRVFLIAIDGTVGGKLFLFRLSIGILLAWLVGFWYNVYNVFGFVSCKPTVSFCLFSMFFFSFLSFVFYDSNLSNLRLDYPFTNRRKTGCKSELLFKKRKIFFREVKLSWNHGSII